MHAEQLRSKDVAYITSVLATTNTTRDGILNELEAHGTLLDSDSILATSQPSFPSITCGSLCDIAFNKDSQTERGKSSPVLTGGACSVGTVRRCLKPLTARPSDFSPLPAKCLETVGSEQADLIVSASHNLSTIQLSSTATDVHHTSEQEMAVGCKFHPSNSTPSFDPETEEETFLGENSILYLDDSLEVMDETAVATDNAPNGDLVLTQALPSSVDRLEHKQDSSLDVKRIGLSTENLLKQQTFLFTKLNLF